MWKQKDKLNSTKIDILEKHYKVDLEDAKHSILKTEYYKPIKGSDYEYLRNYYHDSFLYSLKNNKHYYCFTENEIQSKEPQILLPWKYALRGYTIANGQRVSLMNFYAHSIEAAGDVLLSRIEYKGRFYYIAAS